MVKLPRDPGPLTIDEADLVDWSHEKMVRIHGTIGPHALHWHQLRHFGPTSTRFDPHPPPPATHADFAVMYAAADSFPPNPQLSLPLTDPGLLGALEAAAERINYAIT